MQYIIRYDVEQAKTEAFRNWLLESDTEMRAGGREGWTYLGTWMAVQGFGDYDVETRWELDDYAALGADMPSQSLKFMRQWLEFADDRRRPQTTLLKSASDVILFHDE